MKISHFLTLSIAACLFVTVGCGGRGDTTVIESEQVSAEEQYDADAAYSEQADADYESYDQAAE